MSDPVATATEGSNWSKTPPTKPGEYWMKGEGFKTAVVHVYEAKVHKPGGMERQLQVSHPSFGHRTISPRMSSYLDRFEWGPEVSEPPA
jgi:hypothetical protein